MKNIFANNMNRFIIKGLLVFILMEYVQSQDWKEPYFECFPRDDFKINCTQQQVVDVEEEIPWPFNLVKLIYNGDNKPRIEKFFAGDNNRLNATFERQSDGYWFIKINNRQDYDEVDAIRLYAFDIYIRGTDGESTTPRSLRINLKNIFDNKPEVRYIGPIPCSWRAYEENVDTNCTVLIKDIDGLIGNKITMSVEGNNNAEEHFNFTLKRDSITEYTQEYFINIMKELDYDISPWYNLKIFAKDIAENEGHGEASFSVINVPHKPPRWIQPLVTETFPEKQEQTFNVVAISGDIGINEAICYFLIFTEQNYSDIINIDETTGTLNINKIDRDARQQQIYKFEIWAKKCDSDDPNMQTPSTTVLIVEDINDNIPIITIQPKILSLHENQTKPIILDVFDVSDIDLGEHAMYDVYLASANEAFDVIPSSGYQNSSFQLTIKDKNFLDYENESWRDIEVKIVAQEKNISTHIDEFILNIKLINWNDEPPYFPKESYSVELNETVPKGYIIEEILAIDRDIDDLVTYKIVGNFYGIDIDNITGIMSTLENDVFDYDRQKTVIIQVQATDTLVTNYVDEQIHSAFTQLTINVKDVNNKTPELRMPRIVPNCTENSTDIGTITELIRATDPDTDANLIFKIDWEQTYATKTGKEAEKATYEDCFIIEAHPKTINEVYGHLKLNPLNKTIVDYEMYDTMYLFIIVTDLNQVVNEPSSNATLTVIIDDINDCAPRFIQNTLEEPRVVKEEATGNSPAGNLILAIDDDGPGNNNITYSISPIKETNSTWIKIGKYTGVLNVEENAVIDCDIPRIDGLYYEVELYDGLHVTKGNIMINVTDINNKVPEFNEFNRTVEIYEKCPNGTFVVQILGYDMDRDEPHNVLEYSINFQIYKDLEKFFQLDKLNGSVYVNLQDGWKLDRDHNVTEHLVNVDVIDNYLDSKSGRRNSKHVSIRVILLDINDNAPTMPSPKDYLPKINENALEGTELEDHKLIANDIDQPDHPNSWVSFKILNITKGEECKEDVTDYENLFTIESDHKKKEGTFKANKDLKGYYGIWKVHIEAYDHGEPRQSSNETFNLEVLPFNFHIPQIVFPTNEIIRLRHDQKIDSELVNTDKTKLRSFEAFDPDGGIYGNVTFDIISDAEYFSITYINRSHSNLVLKKKIEVNNYELNIRAKDGGGQDSNITRARIFIVDMNADPVFAENTFNTNFTENEKGLEESRILPEAIDPKNDGIVNEEEKFKIYYYLDTKYNENITEMFKLEKELRILTLLKPLNRLETTELYIRAIATNSKEEYITNFSEKSTITIKIKINDANPRPIFDEKSKKYGASITINDYEGKSILQVHANDSDIENSITTYAISSEIVANGINIESIKNNIFELNSDTGVFTLKKKVESSMEGYFEFNITAEDNYGNKDEANVKVYIIAESNRISFSFLSEYSTIKANEYFLKTTLREQYGYDKCNIDDISNSTKENEDGSTTKFVTVRVHFIQNNEPIDANEILKKTNQQTTNTLKNKFIKENIYLDAIQNSKNTSVGKIKITESITFIIIAAILGVLCGLLGVAFYLKTKALNRQLKAFAPPEFGSRASDLNRIGVPTTNVFSVEGSNPVINDNIIKEEFDDTSSIDSDGSDFVGINNDVNFMMKNDSVSSKNSSIISQYEKRKNNSNDDISFNNNDDKIMRF